MINVKIKKLHPDAIVPTYATDGSGCFDLYAPHPTYVSTDDPTDIAHTGLAFEIPDGHVMLIFSRSGHGFNDDVRLANCVGVIDSDYRGEVAIKLRMDPRGDDHTIGIKPRSRVAQALVIPYPRVNFELVDELSDTARGAGGFGSTGS